MARDDDVTMLDTHRNRIGRLLLAIGGMLGLVIFLVLVVEVRRNSTPWAWDIEIARTVQSVPGLAWAMFALSWPGWSPQSWAIILAATTFVYVRGARAVVLLPLASLAMHLLATAIKIAIARPRPDASTLRVLSEASDASFPSGHAAQYTLFLGYLGYLGWSCLPPGWPRRAVVLTCLALIALVGVSRVYLGHHWPSDVIGGYGLGAAMLSFLIGVDGWSRRRARQLR